MFSPYTKVIFNLSFVAREVTSQVTHCSENWRQDRSKAMGSHPTRILQVEEALEFDKNFHPDRLVPGMMVFMLAGAILVSSKPIIPSKELRVHFQIFICFEVLLSPQVFQHPILFIKAVIKQ